MCYWNFKVSLKGPFGLITRTHRGNLKLQSWTKTKSLKNEESFAMKTSDASFISSNLVWVSTSVFELIKFAGA